ncbi:MAG: PAS domain-containing protein [Acidimicrobiia bacterium]
MSEQQPVEMILLRQLASYLSIAIWLMDDGGNLVYYNEPAEGLLGAQFDDMGPVHAEDLASLFRVTDVDGNPLEDKDLPVVAALIEQEPRHGQVHFCGFDGRWHDVEIAAVPLVGAGQRFLGVFVTFWETRP